MCGASLVPTLLHFVVPIGISLLPPVPNTPCLALIASSFDHHILLTSSCSGQLFLMPFCLDFPPNGEHQLYTYIGSHVVQLTLEFLWFV